VTKNTSRSNQSIDDQENKPYPDKTPYNQSEYHFDNTHIIPCYYCKTNILLSQTECLICGQVNPFHSTKLHLLGGSEEEKSGLKPGQPVRKKLVKEPKSRAYNYRSQFSGSIERKHNVQVKSFLKKNSPLIAQSDGALSSELNHLKQAYTPIETTHRKEYLEYQKISNMTSPYNFLTFFSGLIGLFNLNNELGAFAFIVTIGVAPFYFLKKSQQNKLLPSSKKKSNESFEKEQKIQNQIKNITYEIGQRNKEKEFLIRLNKDRLNTHDINYKAPSRGALMYYLSLNDGHYKIGVTSRSIKERFKGGERKRFSVVGLWRFNNEKAAYRYEYAVLRIFSRYKPRNYNNKNLKYGHSEVFNKNILDL